MTPIKFDTVDQYIASFPEGVAKKLNQIRKVIRSTAPDAEELISYNIPGYKYHGMLIYFAAHTNHIGIYPLPKATGTLARELEKRKSSKATVKLPLDEPIPVDLVRKIVQLRVKMNLDKKKLKEAEKKLALKKQPL